MSKKKFRTDFLFPRTNLVVGMGSIINISGRYFDFNYSDSGEEADSKAIESDWGNIGLDIENVVKANPIENFETANCSL